MKDNDNKENIKKLVSLDIDINMESRSISEDIFFVPINRRMPIKEIKG